jgi:hypothetical protein
MTALMSSTDSLSHIFFSVELTMPRPRVDTYEMLTNKVPVHKVPAYEVHAHEVHAHEVACP